MLCLKCFELAIKPPLSSHTSLNPCQTPISPLPPLLLRARHWHWHPPPHTHTRCKPADCGLPAATGRQKPSALDRNPCTARQRVAAYLQPQDAKYFQAFNRAVSVLFLVVDVPVLSLKAQPPVGGVEAAVVQERIACTSNELKSRREREANSCFKQDAPQHEIPNLMSSTPPTGKHVRLRARLPPPGAARVRACRRARVLCHAQGRAAVPVMLVSP